MPVFAGGASGACSRWARRSLTRSTSTATSGCTGWRRLVSVALDNAENRRELAEQATTDSVTGLGNHRHFHEELARQVARARRDGEPLAIALFDIDNFKTINDTLGHQSGDEMLRAVATVLRSATREGEVVARLGGDEFAMILPRTDDVGAEMLGRRVRALVSSGKPMADHLLTLSAGVCDLDHAHDADSLVRFADGALYWVNHGRDAVCRYAQEHVDVLWPMSAPSAWPGRRPTSRCGRSHARSMSRTRPRTGTPSGSANWPSGSRRAPTGGAAAVQAARSGALHDVGKIAVPDRILHKPGPLDPGEHEEIKEHAAIGRGSSPGTRRRAGEPDPPSPRALGRRRLSRRPGRRDDPDRAQILALADPLDVMTHSRHYREPLAPEAAVAECRRHRATQFSPAVVDQLDAALVRFDDPPG